MSLRHKIEKGAAYRSAVAAVALHEAAVVGAVLEGALDPNRRGYGSAMAAPVVGLAVLEASRGRFVTREGGSGIRRAVCVAIRPNPAYVNGG